MSLFNIVHILKLVIFENMLAYKNVKSYMLSITYGFEQNLSVAGTPFKLEHGLHLGHNKTIKIK
jgi:hypothetical protein